MLTSETASEGSREAKKPCRGFGLLLADMKNNLPGLLAAAGYILIFQLFFTTICPMQLLFGLPCPGCGLTRAAFLLLRGDLPAAFAMHPFLFAWILLVCYWAVCRYVLGRKAAGLLQLTIAVCVLMVLFYIYRMLHDYPHTEPMNPLMEGLLPRLYRQLTGI